MLTKDKIIQIIHDSFEVTTNLNLETHHQAKLYCLANKVLADQIVIQHLDLIANYDSETFGHCLRTGMIVADLYLVDSHLESPKQTNGDLETNMVAGFLHDYGKREIPLEILKAEKYTNEERREYITELKEDDREGERRATKRRKSRPWIKRCQRLLNLADILDGIGSVREYQKILPNKPFTNQEIITALNNTFPAEQPLIKHIQETYLNNRIATTSD